MYVHIYTYIYMYMYTYMYVHISIMIWLFQFYDAIKKWPAHVGLFNGTGTYQMSLKFTRA